ncbi:DUF1697 domain-containing protein [Methylovirgula sp. 4M-Z18]|uniref:DUF1697 domain-containing protein n=1 Tax=Methylovirgula sp. 4M-Z18 TaxID=2293567 RepID=UPI000E2FB419|nr:DUF1697 domain-containing protein [Methylovirgula sp. 4M-Z18]RFB79287.1 DUF1697 domain-containing protein [Methylovirgula sp. 4M-Z18]
MDTWIALFRGINVGGNNLLPMKALAVLVTDLGGRDVTTYIQSGNVVFRGTGDAAAWSKRIGAAVEKAHGFRPAVLMLRTADLDAAIKANPFPMDNEDPKALHLVFLAAAPAKLDRAGFDALKVGREAYALHGNVFYFFAPDGIGRSKLGAKMGKLLGQGTARNWRTVLQLQEMAHAAETSA